VTGKGVQESWQFLLFDIDFDRSILIVNDVHACMRMHALVSIKLFLHLRDWVIHVMSFLHVALALETWYSFPGTSFKRPAFSPWRPAGIFEVNPRIGGDLVFECPKKRARSLFEKLNFMFWPQKKDLPPAGVEDLEVSRWRVVMLDFGKAILYAKEQLVSE
jgi:hypothetical protein